jgi:chromosome segregation ATPase
MGFFKKIFAKPAAEPLSLTSPPATKIEEDATVSESIPEDTVQEESHPFAAASTVIVEDAASAVAVGKGAVGILSPPAVSPAPLKNEGEAIQEAWRQIVDLQTQVRAEYERIREIASNCGEKDRQLFERVRETQEILGGVSDVLAGKDRERTLAEIDDLLAEKIGLGDEPRDSADIQGVLLILQEKAQTVLGEMKSFFHRTRTTLVQVEALKQQRQGRLAVLDKQLEEIVQTRDLAEGFQKQVIGEKRSLEAEIDSVNASRQNIEAQISLLEERIQKAMEEKVTVEDQTREVDAVKGELQERLEAGRRELEETEGIVENLRQTLTGLEEERGTVERELKTFLKEKDRLADDIQVIEKSRQDQSRQITHLEEEIEATQHRMEQLHQEIEEIRTSADALTTQRDAREETTVSDIQKMEELETQLALLIEEKTSLEETVEQEKESLRQKQEEWKHQTEQLVEKNENIQLVQDEIDRISDEIRQCKKQTEELLAGKAVIERQMETATAAGDTEESIEVFEEELRRLTVERDDLHQALKHLETEIRSEEAQVKELLLQKEQESRNRQDLDEHLKTAREEVAELRKKLDSARKVSTVVKEEMGKAAVGLEQQKLEIEERVQSISRLSEERSALEEEIVRVEQESEVKVSGAALSARDTVYEVVEEGTIGAPPMEKSEELSPAQKKAQRLARVIVSDIILYNKEILKTAANQRNFYEILEQPIRRSEEYYREKVPQDIQGDRDYLKEEMEKLRLSLKP